MSLSAEMGASGPGDAAAGKIQQEGVENTFMVEYKQISGGGSLGLLCNTHPNRPFNAIQLRLYPCLSRTD
jgi:hypothetical protein